MWCYDMNLVARWCFFLLCTLVQCTHQLSCHTCQKDDLTRYWYSDPEGVLDAQPTGCEVSYEDEDGTNIANLNGDKLPYVTNVTIHGITTSTCISYIGIRRDCISERRLFEVPCNINCNEPTPCTVDQSPKPTPSTVDQSPKPTPSTVDQSPKPTPSTVDQSPKPTPSTVDQSPKPTQRNYLLLVILLTIGGLVAIAVIVVLVRRYKRKGIRCSMLRFYKSVTTNEEPSARDAENGRVN